MKRKHQNEDMLEKSNTSDRVALGPVLGRAALMGATALGGSLALSALDASDAQANPLGGNVVGGSATIAGGAGETIITQTSNRAIIEWQDFSIGKNELVRFIQPGAGSAVLNRVVSSIPSSLLGQLKANGRVYLINPNGIMIGQGAVINTNGFVASTLDVVNQDFMQAKDLLFKGDSTASVINEGGIYAKNGDIYLVAREVRNSGTIKATNGEVGMGAGREVLLAEKGHDRMAVRVGYDKPGQSGVGVSNEGLIEATRVKLEAANGNIYGLAIKNSGTIRATGITTSADGRIMLSAGSGRISAGGTLRARNADGSGGRVDIHGEDVRVSARIDASAVAGHARRGGQVRISGREIRVEPAAFIDASGDAGGGSLRIGAGLQGSALDSGDSVPLSLPARRPENVIIESGASLVADARDLGDGGEVIVWSDEDTEFHGSISAKGGAQGGNGGFAEVSGKENLLVTGLADLTAVYGHAGELLLDPGSITIVNGGTGFSTWNTVNDGYLGQQLQLADVTVSTTNATNGGAGDITLTAAASIDWSADTTLTFDAARDVEISGDINNSGAGRFDITAGGDINVHNGAELRWNAPTAVNTDPSSATASWVAGGSISFDGRISAMGSGTWSLKANGGDVVFGSNTDLDMVHTWDPAGAASSQTGYANLKVDASGSITTDGLMRNVGGVTLTSGDQLTLNADMTATAGDHGISWLDGRTENDLLVNGNIDAVGSTGSNSVYLQTNNGDLVINANIDADERAFFYANNGMLHLASGQVETQSNHLYLRGNLLKIDSGGRFVSGYHTYIEADDADLQGQIYQSNDGRWIYFRAKSADTQLCLGDAVCADTTPGSMLHLTQAEIDLMPRGHLYMGSSNRIDDITTSSDVDFGSRHLYFKTQTASIDHRITKNNGGEMRFYARGSDIYLGDGGTAAFHLSEAEIANLQSGSGSWLRFYSENGDITVDHVSIAPSDAAHFSVDAGAGDVRFIDSTGSADPSISVRRYMEARGNSITVEAGGQIEAATTGSDQIRFYATDHLYLNDDVTASGASNRIILDGDNNRDGVGGVHFGAGVAVTVPDSNSSIDVYTPEMDTLHANGADGLYLNGGALSIIPTVTINPGDILAMGLGDIANCQIGFCSRADVHVFGLDQAEHFDHFYNVGSVNYGSDLVDVLILGHLDYSTLVDSPGPGSLTLAGDDIRFDEEFKLGYLTSADQTNAAHADYMRPKGAFDSSVVALDNPTDFLMPADTDLIITPTEGRNIAGGLAAPTVNAYFGDKAFAPTEGLVISNDFLNVFNGRNLILGTEGPGTNRPFRAAVTTINGLDTTSSFSGSLTVGGDRVRVEGDGVVANGQITLNGFLNFVQDTIVIDGTVTSKTDRIAVNAYNQHYDLQGTVTDARDGSSVQYNRYRGGKVVITENGKLVNEQNGGNDYVTIQGRAIQIDSTADPSLNPAIVSSRTANLYLRDQGGTVQAYFGANGTANASSSHFTADQLARIDTGNGGLKFSVVNEIQSNNNYRTDSNIFIDGLDGDTAFANIGGDISITAGAQLNSTNNSGKITFQGAASDLGQRNYHLWGQGGIVVNADVTQAEGYGLHLEAGYIEHGNNANLRNGSITGTGLIDSSYLRLQSVGGGIGTAASGLRTRTGSLWAENRSNIYTGHGSALTGGIYIDNDSGTGLAVNQAHNYGSGDIVINQTGGGAIYVADDHLDYGANNPWGLTTSGVISSSDQYTTGGNVRWAAPGDIELNSTGGIVVMNTIAVEDQGADVLDQVDNSYDDMTDNVHVLNGGSNPGYITVDSRASSWTPAGYTVPTVTLNGGTDLRLDRGLDLGTTDELHIGGAQNVIVAAPITSAKAGPNPGFSITADQNVYLGTNADLTTTATDGTMTITAVNGQVQMSDDALSGTASPGGLDPLPADGTAVAAGETLSGITVTVNGYSLGVDTIATAGNELKAGTILREGTVLKAGTVLPMTVQLASGGTLAAGTALGADDAIRTPVALTADTVLVADVTLGVGSMVAENSVFHSASLSATGTSGSLTVTAGTDIALGRLSTFDGDITLRAGTGGVSGAILDNVTGEMADTTDIAFSSDPTRTDNANLLTEGGNILLSGKSIGTASDDGSTFVDIHSRAGGDVKVIDPADPDPANPTLAGAWGTDSGDGAYISILDSSTVGEFDMIAEAGIGLMQGVGDLNWGAGSNARTLGGGDILLITQGLNGSSGNITFTGDLDATNTVTGVTGDVVLRAKDNVISSGGKITGARLVVTATDGTVGAGAGSPLRTDVQAIDFGSQNGVWIQDEGTDLTKTVTVKSIQPVTGIDPAGDVRITAEANIGIDGVTMTDGNLVVTSNQGDITQIGVAGITSLSSGAGYNVTLNAAGSIGDASRDLDIDLAPEITLTATSGGTDLAAGQGTYLRSLNDFANGASVNVNSGGHVTLAGLNNLDWDNSVAVSLPAAGTMTLRADGNAAGTGDVTLHATVNRAAGGLVIDAARNIGASAPGNLAIADHLTLNAGNSIDLDINASRLDFAVGAGGANIREVDSVTASGSALAWSNGNIDLSAGGDLTVGGTSASAVSGDGSGYIYSDGAGTVTLTSGGDILLDGQVGSAKSGTAGQPYSLGSINAFSKVGSGGLNLLAAGDIVDVSDVETLASDNKTSTSLNILTNGNIALTAGGSIGRDSDNNAATGLTNSIDVFAGGINATASGTASGEGVYLTLLDGSTTAALTSVSSGRNIGIESVGSLNVVSGTPAAANGYTAFLAATDMNITAGANVNSSGDLLLSAGNDLTMSGGTVQATGSGMVTLQAGNDLLVEGGTLTHMSGSGMNSMRVAVDGSPLKLQNNGVLLDGGNVTLDNVTVSTADSSGITIVGSKDVTLVNSTVETTGSGDVILVSDHRTNATTGGMLRVDATSSINSGGDLGLFVPREGTTSIQGLLNGASFQDVPQNLGTWFGSSSWGFGAGDYSLFYERGVPAPLPPVVDNSDVPDNFVDPIRTDLPGLGEVQIGGQVRVRERMPERRIETSSETGVNPSPDVSYGVYFERRRRVPQAKRLLSIDSFDLNPDKEFTSALPDYRNTSSKGDGGGGGSK